MKLTNSVYSKIWMSVFYKKIFQVENESCKVMNLCHARKVNDTNECFTKGSFYKEFPDSKSSRISNFGGYTKVVFDLPQGKFEGKYNFGKTEQFCKSYGAMIACKKALNNVHTKEILDDVTNQTRILIENGQAVMKNPAAIIFN